MGYYVEIIDSSYVIPVENLDDVYWRFVKLNDFDDAKRGGSWGGEFDAKTPRPEGYSYHPGRWFSWMHADYPDHYSNAEEILIALGFDVEILNDGSIAIRGYDNKTGQEELFLDSIYDLARGAIYWRGEDGRSWTTEAGVYQNIIDLYFGFNDLRHA